MKKLSVLLLCVLLVAVLVIPAFAAGETAFTITANKASVSKGETVTFTVAAQGQNAFTSLGLDLQYDSSVFELVDGGCTFTAPAGQMGMGFFYKDMKAIAYISMSGAMPLNGQVGTFTLKAIADCPTTSSVSLIAGVKNDAESVATTVNAVSVKIAGEHNYGAWTTAGDENHSRTCSACGNTETAKHTWVDGAVIKQPTCAAEGQKNQACSCGATKVVSIPTNNAHTYDAGEVTTKPGCETEGVMTYTCANGCGKTKTEAIKAIGHKYGEGEVTTKPGCETEGVMTYTCANGCGKPKTEKINPTGHKYGEGEVTTKPGCETEGVMTYNCINGCGKKKTEVIKPTGHTPAADAEVTKQPTCEAPGMMTGKCAVCGEALTNQEIPALGHNYELTATVEPTCDKAGSKTYVCKNDATHTYQEPIAALGHTYGEWTEVDEKEHKQTCATCGNEVKAEHTWDSGFVTKEATCAEAGEKLYTCTDKCGAEKTEVIPATGVHEGEEYADNNDGKTHTATCACGEVITEAHAYLVNGDIIVKPTTSSEGQQEMLCVCGAKTIKTLPKLEAELDDVPKTGDITGQIVLFAVAIVATMTAAGYGMKRVFGK